MKPMVLMICDNKKCGYEITLANADYRGQSTLGPFDYWNCPGCGTTKTVHISPEDAMDFIEEVA